MRWSPAKTITSKLTACPSKANNHAANKRKKRSSFNRLMKRRRNKRRPNAQVNIRAIRLNNRKRKKAMKKTKKKRARMVRKIKRVTLIGLKTTHLQSHQLSSLKKKTMKLSVASAGIAITSLRTLSCQFASAAEASGLSITSASSTG